MNGRVYDPTLGRFLSADPNVQAPDDTQSFNRYSYVKNNPLSYTDPSGFFFKKIFKKIASVFKKAFKAVKSFVKKALQNQYVTTAIQIGINFVPGLQGWGAVLVSAAFSGLVSLANGGDLGQALMSAGIAVASAAAFSAVGDLLGHATPKFLSPRHIAKIVAHGAVGGAISKLRGGEFKSGFLAGAFTQFAAPGLAYADQYTHPAVGVAAAAVAGGVGEELGGGKFANGAITGAFSRLYNDQEKLGDEGEPDSGGWLDGFQLGLDVVGLIPVVGNAADVLNGIIYTARGDAVNAGLSFGAALPGAGQGVTLAKLGRRALSKVCSFKAGTLVHTKGGLKPIEAIRVGDLVASKDEKTGERGWKPVLHLFQSKDKPILDLTLVGPDGEVDVIETTAEHPFWVEGKGWVQTSALAANDKIESLEGDDLVVQSMSLRAGTFSAYNFEVADFHTYFVGDDGAWVHNDCWTSVSFKGLAKNRALGSLTDAELNKAFNGTGYSLSGHALKRLRDPRLQGYGFNTLSDVSQVFNKGAPYAAERGAVGRVYRGIAVVMDPKTKRIITIRPE
uniref:polymorphic toxin-type HINT domain-containing protein n=1 Tax=Pelagibius sp. Alg239-R121 TaxID=2993448 RepID=UPI0024A7176A